MRTIPSINNLYILLLFLVSFVLFFSCNRKIPTIKEKNTNYELYSISPDGPFKLLINGTKIKTENAYCLNYEEQKFLSEYVSLDTLKIDPKKAHKYHDTERCNIPFNEITLIEQFGNIKLYKTHSIYDNMDRLKDILFYMILRDHQNYYELINLGTEIDTLDIKTENFEDFVSIIWFTKAQMMQMNDWIQIEELSDEQINELKNYFEHNLDAIKTQIKKEVPYSSHPYRTPEVMQITAKALLLHKINPMASQKRYKQIYKILQ